MAWIEQLLLLLRQAFSFSWLSFLPAFFPMLSHGLLSTGCQACLSLSASFRSIALNDTLACYQGCSSPLNSKTKFPTACLGFFACVFIPPHADFHFDQCFEVISPNSPWCPLPLTRFTVPLPSPPSVLSSLPATFLICISFTGQASEMLKELQ